MKVLQQLFNFYLNASVHVALAVYALTYITLIAFEITYHEAVLYFVFYATITGYNFVKYFGLAKFHHRSLAAWLKAIQILLPDGQEFFYNSGKFKDPVTNIEIAIDDVFAILK